MYMLKKDIGERAAVLVILMLLYSGVMFVIATMITGSCKENLCTALNVLFYAGGVGGLAGGIGATILGVRDYRFWKKHIRTPETLIPIKSRR